MAIEVTNTPETGVNGTTKRTVKSTLGKDDFLLLLTQQLKNQDPLKPMENTEFVSQMANFSSLEQMSNMNKSLEKFITTSNESYKMQAMGILGGYVTALPSGQVEPVSGYATSVKFVDGEAVFKVNGKEIKMSEITKIDVTEGLDDQSTFANTPASEDDSSSGSSSTSGSDSTSNSTSSSGDTATS